MLLETILDTVRYGELNNISIDDEKIPQIINYINLGLIQLYSKFPVQEKQVIIQQYPQISMYVLDPKYARSNRVSSAPHKYILDTPDDPFVGDVMFITGICDEWGIPRPLNDDHSPRSYFLVSHNTLQIPNANEHESTFVIYRAKPRIVNPKQYDPMEYIELPEYLLEPLTTYVGYKAMQALGSQEGVQQAQAMLERFNMLCQEINANNLMGNNVSPSNIKLGMRGFK